MAQKYILSVMHILRIVRILKWTSTSMLGFYKNSLGFKKRKGKVTGNELKEIYRLNFREQFE